MYDLVLTIKTHTMNSLKITVEKSVKNTEEISKLINEIAFWNKNGQNIFDENKAGTMGDKSSQELAKNSPIELFVLNTVAAELKTLLPSFKTGRGGSHIWICEFENERNILITF